MESAREKILIIESHAASSASLVELLGGAGYQVSTASAQEAVRVARERGADLVLLDAQLPGFAPLLSELKGSAATSNTRVVLLSAGDPDKRARGLDLGADDVVSHPWDSEELLAGARAVARQACA